MERFEHWSVEDILNNYYYFEAEEEEADGGGEEATSSQSSGPADDSQSRTRSCHTSGHLPAADLSQCAADGHPCPKIAALVPFSRLSDEGAESSSTSCRTYAQVTGVDQKESESEREKEPLCPFAFNSSDCPSRETCRYLHGLFCDLCNRCCLHPFSEKQRRDHREVRSA